jgi:hypothetical protein
MTQTAGERRAYSRGYNRGRTRVWSVFQRVVEIAKGYRARLADVDTQRICATCRRWERGCETCHWGYCGLDFEFQVEPRMWPDRRDYQRLDNGVTIATSEQFGCPCWLPKAPAGDAR